MMEQAAAAQEAQAAQKAALAGDGAENRALDPAEAPSAPGNGLTARGFTARSDENGADLPAASALPPRRKSKR
jgi:hypothetical protein